MPVAGSAYTFSYATLGELIAWIIGWDLVLEFTVGSAALSTGFSAYLKEVLEIIGVTLPTSISSAADGVVDLPAMLIAFFAFIGFDIVATTAEEARNPQRDVPIGILGSLAIVTVLYAAVSLVVTGMQAYSDIDPESAAPLAEAFEAAGVSWMPELISIGACIGLVVVAMILMLGQTRVAFAMARDGLLPRGLAKVHPQFGTPYRITMVTGIAVAALAGFVDLTTLAHLVNIGTLFAFVLVSIGVVVLRRTRPDLPRGFRTPVAPLVAGLATLMCAYLMLNLTGGTWVRFVVWMALGVVVYFAYGRSRSRLGSRERQGNTLSP